MTEPTEKELISAAMVAATDLIQTHNSSLSTKAIQTRMKRIAQDLLDAAGETL
jgi:hypothetical protein